MGRGGTASQTHRGGGGCARGLGALPKAMVDKGTDGGAGVLLHGAGKGARWGLQPGAAVHSVNIKICPYKTLPIQTSLCSGTL